MLQALNKAITDEPNHSIILIQVRIDAATKPLGVLPQKQNTYFHTLLCAVPKLLYILSELIALFGNFLNNLLIFFSQ